MPDVDARVGVQLQAEVGVGGEHVVRLSCKRLEAAAAKIMRAVVAVHAVLVARRVLIMRPRQLAVAVGLRFIARRRVGGEGADNHMI